MSRPIDTLANAERAPEDRPAPDRPALPDLVPEERPWTGSASEEISRWRNRAIAAEELVERLQKALLRHRITTT